MHRSRSAAPLLAVLLLAGCVTATSRINGDRKAVWPLRIQSARGSFDLEFLDAASVSRDTVRAIIQEVWSRLPESYSELAIPLDGVNPEAWLLGNVGFRAHGRLGGTPMTDYLQCGRTLTGDVADRYEVRLAVATQLHEAEGGTVVVSAVSAHARPQAVSGNALHCTSTGLLERRIVQRIRRNLVEPRGAGG